MATSNGFTVPSTRFVVETDRNDAGRWFATVTYRVKDGRAWRDIVGVTVREMPTGTIELDTGSREPGGRARIGTHDHQEAVDEAVVQVEKMGKAALRGEEIQRTIYAGDGQITILGGYKVWRDAKLAARVDGEGVTDATLRHVEQACEIAVNMKGRDFRLAELVGDMDGFVKKLLKYRQDGFTFDAELVEKLQLTSTGIRKPSHPNTAAKDARRVCEVINLVAKTVDPKDPDHMLLQPNPVATNNFTWPKEDTRGQGKTPIGWDTQALLFSPLRRGDSIEPSPLNQADDDGATRFVAAILGHHGTRRETPLILQRKHIATTPAEVRVMLKKHGRYLRDEDMAEFDGRFWILHKDTKMAYLDPVHYTRPVPCNDILEAEVRRYLDRHNLWDIDPESYLVADPDSDRSKPYSVSALYRAAKYETVKDDDGEQVLGDNNYPVPIIADDGLPVVIRNEGRFEKAFQILREYLHAQGVDWTKHVPVKMGESMHGFRTNLEEELVGKLWIQIADVKGLDDQNRKMNLARYADYLLNRKMHDSDRNERYAMLEPLLLLAIVDFENGLEAAARQAQIRQEETGDAMEAMRRAAGVRG